MSEQPIENGQWAIVEIMGRKVVAGYASQSVKFGVPLVRIDIPETSVFPAFTQEYGGPSIYAITYVSEEVARMAAETAKVNPVAVYIPDLAEMQRAKLENERLRQEIRNLRALPSGGPGDPSTDPSKLEGEFENPFESDGDDDDMMMK